jgi:Skp family chaperone for outer membrane proteins
MIQPSRGTIFLLLGIFFICSFLCAGSAQGEFRVATVDINKVLNSSKDAQKQKKELDKLSQKAKEQIQTRRKELEKMESRLKEDKASEESEAVDRFRSEARDFQRFVKDQEEDLKVKFLKTNKELTEKALGIVRDYARKNSIDLVLDKGTGVGGAVLFTSADKDITDQVIAYMNE